MRGEAVGNQQGEAIKVSKVAKASTTTVPKYSSFVDIMKALLNYNSTFALYHGFDIYHEIITEIIKEVMSMQYLSNSTHATYVPYSWFARLLVKNKNVLTLLSLSDNHRTRKELGVSHLDFHVLYLLNYQDFIFKGRGIRLQFQPPRQK